MYIKAVGSSSPPPAQSYNMKIKDRTTVVKATAKPMYRDSFEDIEVRCSSDCCATHSRD